MRRVESIRNIECGHRSRKSRESLTFDLTTQEILHDQFYHILLNYVSRMNLIKPVAILRPFYTARCESLCGIQHALVIITAQATPQVYVMQ